MSSADLALAVKRSKCSSIGDFRCGALLFVVIHVIYKYKNR